MLESDIIEKVYEISDEIKRTDEYKSLLRAYNALISDEESSALILEFEKKKDLYERKFISDKEMSEIKKKLYTSPLYIEYSLALKKYNDMTKEIEDEINQSIFSKDTNKLVKMK